MPSAIGTEMLAACARASAWGVAAVCGAGHGVLTRPHTITKERGLSVDDSLGQAFALEADPEGHIKVEGTLPLYLRYDGLDLLLGLAMGATAGAPVQQAATPAYSQRFLLNPTLEGLFLTLAVDNRINIDEYPTAKIAGLTLKGRIGEPVEMQLRLIASDRVTGSALNTAGSFASVTLGSRTGRVLCSQAVFRMNAADAGALGGSDIFLPSSFELSLERPMSGSAVAGTGNDLIDEPLPTGPLEVKLKIELPRYTSTSHFDAWDAATPRKMDIVFTGAEIESPYSRKFSITMPNLAPSAAGLPIERGPLRHTLEYRCLAASSAPAGMSGITLPLEIGVVNTCSVNVLA